MNCTQCGAPIPEDAGFCTNCGATVVAEDLPPVSEKLKKKRKIWPLICLAVILVAAVALVLILTGKKETHLIAEVTNVSSFYTNVLRYEYDDEGRIVRISSRSTYDYEEDEDFVSTMEYEYEYDDNGLLIKTSINLNGENGTVKYTYDDGVLDRVKVTADGDYDYDVTCTDEGKIKRVELSEEGETNSVYSFRYHDSGKLKSMETEYFYHFTDQTYSNKIKYGYDEEGRTTEYAYYSDNELRHHTEYRYDDEGTKPYESVETDYDEGEIRQQRTTTVEVEWDGDEITEMTVLLQVEYADGTKEEGTISGPVEWDGKECKWLPDTVTGSSDEIMDSIDPELIEFRFSLDESGTFSSYSLIYDGEMQQSKEIEYDILQLPRSYEAPDFNDPIYALFIF